MKLTAVYLEPQNGYKTPLRSDTLWGILCWAIRSVYDEPTLEKFIADYNEGKGAFNLSSCFPYIELYNEGEDEYDKTHYFPLPKLYNDNPLKAENFDDCVREMTTRKDIKKNLTYVSQELFEQILENGKLPNDETLKELSSPPGSAPTPVTRNTIDRIKGGTLERDGRGQLFHVDEYHLRLKGETIKHLLTEESTKQLLKDETVKQLLQGETLKKLFKDEIVEQVLKGETVEQEFKDGIVEKLSENEATKQLLKDEIVKQLLKDEAVKNGLFFLVKGDIKPLLRGALNYLEHTGFGGDRTVGKGWFKIHYDENFILNEPEEENGKDDVNACTTLSLYHPNDATKEVEYFENNGDKILNYTLELRGGRLGFFNYKQVRKNAILMFKEGSVFPIKKGITQYGKNPIVLSPDPINNPGLHHEVSHYGIGFMVKMKL